MPEKLETYEKSAPRVYIRTFGCQMNDRDSEHVLGQFLRNNYKLANTYQEASVVFLNTCSVRQLAEEKVWSELGRLKQWKLAPFSFASAPRNREAISGTLSRKCCAFLGVKPNRGDDYPEQKVLGVIGCMAENMKNIIFERAPYVDIVCGPNDLNKLYDCVNQVMKTGNKALFVSSEARDPSFYRDFSSNDKKHSYVVIMEGCNNYCSYCVVPYVRGKERSRKFGDILAEIKEIISNGISSITLLGQNVNSYMGGCSFPDLLRKVNALEGIKTISFVTSHPKDAGRDLFEAMRDCEHVKKSLHLPIQSGSDRILRSMNRGYTRSDYLQLVEMYRRIVGGSATLGTDIIVGFPGEKEEDFELTRGIMEKVRFNFAFIFKYSVRSGTKAAELKDDVLLADKKRRHKILLELQKRMSTHEK